MTLGTMYPGIENSPELTLAVGIVSDSVDISVNGDVATELPAAPNVFVLGTGEDAETVYYPTDAVANVFYGVTRAFQGVAVSWIAGTPIARLFTAYDYDTLRTNITELSTDKISETIFTAKGDVLTASAADTPVVLPIGTEGQVLTAAADGTIAWATIVGSVTEVTGTAPIVSSGGNQPAISITEATADAPGSLSVVDKLRLDAIEDAADVTDAENVAAAGAIMDTDYVATGDIIVATAASTPTALNVGTDGQVLTSQADGTVAWEDPVTAEGMIQSISAADTSITIVGDTTPTIAVSTAGVTLAKMADLAQDKIIGRSTASTGVPEVITCTAAGRALIDDASASDQRTTLGISVTASLPITATATTTPVIAINAATTSTAGSMSAIDKIKMDAISLLCDAYVYRSVDTVYAVTKAGVVLSSGAYTTANVQIQAALDYLDGLSDAAASGRTCSTCPATLGITTGYHLHICTGAYTIAAPLHVMYPHQVTGDGYTATNLLASSGNTDAIMKIGVSEIYTAGVGTSATQIVCTSLPTHVDDYYNSYWSVYNITRNLKATISDYDNTTKTLTVSIASQASGDTFVLTHGNGYDKPGAIIQDLLFNGATYSNYGIIFNHPLTLGSASKVRIDRCSFRKFNKYGIYENSNWGTRITNCYFAYNPTDGVLPTVAIPCDTVYTAGTGTTGEYIKNCTPDLVGTTDRYYDGWYLWNITKGIGRCVSTFLHTDHSLRCTTAGWGAAQNDTFVLLPPWAGICVATSNHTIIENCDFEGNFNAVHVRGCMVLEIRNCVMQGQQLFGILIGGGTSGTYIFQATDIIIDNIYFEANGSYNNTNTSTYALNETRICDITTTNVTISNIMSADTYLTPARNSSCIFSVGEDVRAFNIRPASGVVGSITGVGSKYVNETSGYQSSVADGGTVTHNMGYLGQSTARTLVTPTWVTATGSVSGEFVSVTAITSTTFTVAIKKHDNSAGTTQTIYYRCGV